MVGWHHWLDEHEFEQAPWVGDRQGSLACCSPWDHKESNMTEQLNWTERLPLPSQPIVSLCSCNLPPLLSMITATLHRLLLQPRMSLPSPPYLSQCLTCGSEWVSEVTQLCLTLCDPMDTRLLHPWDFLGMSTGVGCHFFFQGIFPNKGSNPGLLHCRQTLYHLSHQGHVVRPPQIRD